MQMKQDRADARAAAAAAAASGPNIVKSSSDYSCISYESFVGQPSGQDDNNKEKMSLPSDGLDSVSDRRTISSNKMRKSNPVSVLIFIKAKKNTKIFSQCFSNAY